MILYTTFVLPAHSRRTEMEKLYNNNLEICIQSHTHFKSKETVKQN